MKFQAWTATAATLLALYGAPALAQNIAIVNGVRPLRGNERW